MFTAKIFPLSSGGASVNTGVLQVIGGVALDGTLRVIEDQAGTASPLKMSTEQVAIVSYSATTKTPRIVANSSGYGVFDIMQYGTGSGEYAGVRIRRSDGVLKWQMLNDDNDNFTVYSGSNKAFTVPSAMQNVFAIGLGQPLDATLRAFTTGAADSPLQLSTTQVAVNGTSEASPSFTTGGLFRILGSATNSIVFGTLSTSPFGVYIQGGGNNKYPIILNPLGAGVSVGTTDNSARLHVRGDGTNPTARFEDSIGGNYAQITNATYTTTLTLYASGSSSWIANTGTSVFTSSLGSVYSTAGPLPVWDFQQANNDGSTDNGVVTFFNLGKTIAATSGSTTHRIFSTKYTINNTETTSGATVTGIYLNATETSVTGTTHNLIDVGTGGGSYVSKFKITNKGAIGIATIADADAPNSSLYYSSDAGKLVWKDSTGTVNNLY